MVVKPLRGGTVLAETSEAVLDRVSGNHESGVQHRDELAVCHGRTHVPGPVGTASMKRGRNQNPRRKKNEVDNGLGWGSGDGVASCTTAPSLVEVFSGERLVGSDVRGTDVRHVEPFDRVVVEVLGTVELIAPWLRSRSTTTSSRSSRPRWSKLTARGKVTLTVNLHAKDLDCRLLSLTSSGKVSVQSRVSELLEVRGGGSGLVEYLGTPEVRADLQGRVQVRSLAPPDPRRGLEFGPGHGCQFLVP